MPDSLRRAHLPPALSRRPLEHVWRGTVAGLAGAVMGSGLYVLAPRLVGKRASRPSTRALEWLAASASSIARPLSLARGSLGDGDRPVIMLHGYGMGRSNFSLLARRLSRAGIGPILFFDYWSLSGLERATQRLHELVMALTEGAGYDSVDLIGHSLGGIVARDLASTPEVSGRVGTVVTLGTPHGGTRLAVLGIGRVRRAMLPGSSYLRELGERPLATGIRGHSIWSRADDIVRPAESADWPGQPSVVLDDLGHMSLLYSRRVARATVAALLNR